MESKLEREVQTMLYQCQAGLREISQPARNSHPHLWFSKYTSAILMISGRGDQDNRKEEIQSK